MSRRIRFLFLTLGGIGLSSVLVFGQHTGRSAPSGSHGGPVLGAPTSAGGSTASFSPPVNSFFVPSFGGYGGYFTPFISFPAFGPSYNYAPKYWWTGYYSTDDPRQEGFNPSAGYAKETVTTLLLSTFPAQARVTLDGVFVGTADRLGPTQLPVGEHSLRLDAPTYEPYETILKVEQPSLQQLDVRLDPARAAHTEKPAPRT